LLASGGQGGFFRENCPPAPPEKAFYWKKMKYLKNFCLDFNLFLDKFKLPAEYS